MAQHVSTITLITHKIVDGVYVSMQPTVTSVDEAKALYGILTDAGHRVGVMVDYVETAVVGQTSDVVDWDSISRV